MEDKYYVSQVFLEIPASCTYYTCSSTGFYLPSGCVRLLPSDQPCTSQWTNIPVLFLNIIIGSLVSSELVPFHSWIGMPWCKFHDHGRSLMIYLSWILVSHDCKTHVRSRIIISNQSRNSSDTCSQKRFLILGIGPGPRPWFLLPPICTYAGIMFGQIDHGRFFEKMSFSQPRGPSDKVGGHIFM